MTPAARRIRRLKALYGKLAEELKETADVYESAWLGRSAEACREVFEHAEREEARKLRNRS